MGRRGGSSAASFQLELLSSMFRVRPRGHRGSLGRLDLFCARAGCTFRRRCSGRKTVRGWSVHRRANSAALAERMRRTHRDALRCAGGRLGGETGLHFRHAPPSFEATHHVFNHHFVGTTRHDLNGIVTLRKKPTAFVVDGPLSFGPFNSADALLGSMTTGPANPSTSERDSRMSPDPFNLSSGNGAGKRGFPTGTGSSLAR